MCIRDRCHAARQFRPEALARGGARSVRRKGRGEPFDRFQRNLSRIGQGGGARLLGRAARERPAGRGLCRRRRPVVGQGAVRSRAGRPQQSRRKFGRDRPRYFGAHFGAPDRGTHYDSCPMKGRSRVLAAALCVLPFLATEVPAQEFPRFSCSTSVGTGFGLTRPSSGA